MGFVFNQGTPDWILEPISPCDEEHVYHEPKSTERLFMFTTLTHARSITGTSLSVSCPKWDSPIESSLELPFGEKKD
jgi:hypothetical protein